MANLGDELEKMGKDIDELIGMCKAIQEKSKNNEWIFDEYTLPRYDDETLKLITIENPYHSWPGEKNRPDYIVTVGRYDAGFDCWIIDNEAYSCDTVIAWRPLPAPYIPEKKEE